MKEELQHKLYATYPTLFPALNRRGYTSFERYGFCVGDGWYPLIAEAAEELCLLSSGIVCVQIKEKLGALRFYINSPQHVQASASAIVSKAELDSCKTCEDCGAPGNLESPRYWMRTVCPNCLITWNSKCEKY